MDIARFNQDPVLRRMAIAFLVISLGTLVAVLYHFVLVGKVLGHGYPYNTFLFDQKDRFGDFFNQYNMSAGRDPFVENGAPAAWERTYFPFTYLLMWPLTFLPRNVALIVVSTGFVGCFIAAIYWFVVKAHACAASPSSAAELRNLIIATVLLSYPTLFVLDRGNLEMFVAIPTVLAIFLIGRDDASRSSFFAGSILLGIATALKLFPIVFSLLLLKKKRYREFAIVLVLAIVLNVISMCLFKSSIELTIQGVLAGKRYWLDRYILSTGMIQGGGLAYSSGLLNLLKCFFIHRNLSVVIMVYTALAGLLMLVVAWLVVYGRATYVRCVYLLTMAFLILPHMSGDYRLVYLFVPLMYLVVLERQYGPVEWTMFAAILLALIPKHYYFFYGNASISVLLNPSVMFASMVVVGLACIKRVDNPTGVETPVCSERTS